MGTPLFSTGTPSVLNSDNVVKFSLPVFNTGTAPASNVLITGITLGSAVRTGPVLPLSYHDMAVNSVKMVNAGFAATNFIVGHTYLATVRGTYEVNNISYAFTVNRPIVVPAPTVSPLPLLAAHVEFAVQPNAGTWSYKFFNDEAAGSPRYVNAVSLDIDNSPFVVTGPPPGWAADTDNVSYVLWFSTDIAPPYPSHIAPGLSLGGFQIQSARIVTAESTGLSITSWNHQTDMADLITFGTALTPSQI
jgi:hypothetical protein